MQGRISSRRSAEAVERAQQAQRAGLEAQIATLTAQRSELAAQQGELARRRNQLDEQRHQATGPARADLEARMREIDTRNAQLDDQIQRINDRINQAMDRLSSDAPVVVDAPRVVTIPEINIPPFAFPPRSGPNTRDIVAVMAAEAVVFALIGMAFWRFGLRRMREQFDRMFSNQASQMTQLQNSIDTIAVEVERISEGQRFVAKALSDGSPAGAVPARRVAEPVPGSRSG